ncbi:DUF1772 domain-containing protein [Sinorhizobium psoraleae]|uniref:DUF1772 domain-containing protein n=2 Tax=Sinorhizobium psoraleae TaxID=520838 RepID=A0ABT4KB29_9HYPH|nr:DUF1772 domain-containing protein [Sinorhizobium psoraleae]MCZ4089153.1 DUF1772 domain-containing protein [Sinorhizobium psoraleae]
MLLTLQVLTITVVAIAMALALAHALELPGKLRLGKEQYFAVQPIYYPGFTIGGAAEPASLVLSAVLLFLTPPLTLAFWLIAAAFIGLLAMQAIYWILTHPVNNFWLKDVKLRGMSADFFSLGASHDVADSATQDWTYLRDRWEFSHVARAAFGVISLVLLAMAVAL